MCKFNKYNTEGYNPQELSGLNSEWEVIASSENLEDGTDEYENAYKAFLDEVARR